MSRIYCSILAVFLLLVTQVLPAFAADMKRYTNARFGVTGLFPSSYVEQPGSENGDGRGFNSPDGQVNLLIFGSHDAMGDVPEYRKFLTDTYSQGGEITYQAGGKSWFVLSGYQESNIFYLRVEKARGCDGATVYAHMVIEYPTAIRTQVDPLLGSLAKGLGMAAC